MKKQIFIDVIKIVMRNFISVILILFLFNDSLGQNCKTDDKAIIRITYEEHINRNQYNKPACGVLKYIKTIWHYNIFYPEYGFIYPSRYYIDTVSCVWRLESPRESGYHGAGNLKFTRLDQSCMGSFETVRQGEPTDLNINPPNIHSGIFQQTYNFFDSHRNPIEHFNFDMRPHTYYGAGYTPQAQDCGTPNGTPIPIPDGDEPLNPENSTVVETTNINVVGSFDPNDMQGPDGYGTDHWISSNNLLLYKIRYENSPDSATAPAHKVVITFPLDPLMDVSSFSLGSFGFGSFIFEVPPERISYTARINVVDSLGLYVDVEATIDDIENKVVWTLQSIDPNTGLPPRDPFLGFLPINDTVTHNGEGFVTCWMQPKTTCQTGDTILASAEIVFDYNEPILTNTWKNTIDALPPVTKVDTMQLISNSTTIEIPVTGTDDEGGCGIKSYELYVSKNNEPFAFYKEFNADSTVLFTGDPCQTYYFFSLGKDHVGNKEAMKNTAESFCHFGPLLVMEEPQSQVKCQNENVALSVGIIGINPQYQWYHNNEVLPGENSHLLTFNNVALADSGYYQCKVFNMCDTVFSDTAFLTVKPFPIMNCTTFDEPICQNSQSFVLQTCNPSGGTYSGKGVINNTFIPMLAGPGEHTISYYYATQNGCQNTSQFTITVHPVQEFYLNGTWNGISTFIYPDDPNIVNMFSKVQSNLIILYNFEDIYYPAGGIIPVHTWDKESGYYLKMTNSTRIEFCGNSLINTVLDLKAGWNLVPVLRNTSVSCASLFDPIPEVLLVKEAVGYRIYWKTYGINSLISLIPGKAYLVYAAAPVSFTYPTSVTKSDEAQNPEFNFVNPWNDLIETPSGHLFAFSGSSLNSFQQGDVVGVIDDFGLCRGLMEYKTEQGGLGIVAFGDDAMSDTIDGFIESQSVHFQLFRPSSNSIFELTVRYDNSYLSDGKFMSNGISVIKDVALIASSNVTVDSRIRIYPNPTAGLLHIEGLDNPAVIEIINLLGTVVFTSHSDHIEKVDISGLPQGIYYLKVLDSENATLKAVKIVKN